MNQVNQINVDFILSENTVGYVNAFLANKKLTQNEEKMSKLNIAMDFIKSNPTFFKSDMQTKDIKEIDVEFVLSENVVSYVNAAHKLTEEEKEQFKSEIRKEIAESNPRFFSKYGSEQTVFILTELQKQVPELKKEAIEKVLTKCAEYGISGVFLQNWKKSQRAEERAKKAAKRAARDPNAPKCPKTAFIRYTMVDRNNVKKNYPNYNPKQIMAELGLRWKTMSENERKPFVDEFNVEYDNYRQAKQKYDEEHGRVKSNKRVKVDEPFEMSEKEQAYFEKFQQKFSYFPFNEKYSDSEKKEVMKQKKMLNKYISDKYSEKPEKIETMKNFVNKCKKVCKQV